MIRGCWCWVALVVCSTLQWQHLEGKKPKVATCQQVCSSVGVEDGCNYAPNDKPREEVIVITNGTSDIKTWHWDTITMVVSSYFSSTRTTGLTACYAHSVGKRYGLREKVPADISKLISDSENVQTEFIDTVKIYQRLLMADHMVFDLLDFFVNVEGSTEADKSLAIGKMTIILSHAAGEVRALHDREVFCIVPWQPPCELKCTEMRALLSNCNVLLMSPDSYKPIVPSNGQCQAKATVPISQFLYGVDRYISLRAQPNVAASIVAGIPWHGYAYKCDQAISDDRCMINTTPGGACFDNKNRHRQSLSHIHSASYPTAQVKVDEVTKGLYYNLNNTAQLWFENFTTLLIKYQLVQDLNLRGLSIWYGEDLAMGMSVDTGIFAQDSWNFLTHHVLHETVYRPVKTSHYYANTAAGVGVGCLLLGTALGVTFTCIAFRRSSFRKRNRPFKLDEDESAFRDDEGL